MALGAKHEVLRILGIIAAQDHLADKKIRKIFLKNISQNILHEEDVIICLLSLKKFFHSRHFSDQEKKKILTKLLKQIEKREGPLSDNFSPPSEEEISPQLPNPVNCEAAVRDFLKEINKRIEDEKMRILKLQVLNGAIL